MNITLSYGFIRDEKQAHMGEAVAINIRVGQVSAFFFLFVWIKLRDIC